MSLKTSLFKTGLNGLYYSGAHMLMSPMTRGAGVIFTLHQVPKVMPAGFHPNRILEVTDSYLEAVILRVKEKGLDIVSLDEAHKRLTTPGKHKRFCVFTFDDGYRDNLLNAYPILERHQVPFTIYVPSAYPDGKGELWWLTLEEVVRKQDYLTVNLDGEQAFLDCRTEAEKYAAFEKIYWWLRGVSEDEQRAFVRELAALYKVDMAAQCRDLIMTWDEIRMLADDPLCTIGAHTVGHYAVARLSREKALVEMREGARILECALGKWPEHFSYPYGAPTAAGQRDFALARELGFKTAVTTRPGMLFKAHKDHLTALPRVSLNGDYQSIHYLDLFLSGAPFALFNRFRRLNVA